MDRRKILLVLAAVIAALGTLLVFLYVQGAEDRARAGMETREVLRAVQPIELGESFDAAAQAGKFQLQEVPETQILDGAQTSLTDLTGLVATTPIYVGEQIISSRWAGSADPVSTVLAIPEGMMAISVNLTDPARVAGFVNPGSEVSIMLTGTNPSTQQPFTDTLLDRVSVLGVGTTSTITVTKTPEEGEGEATTTEQLPATLITLALNQADAQRVVHASSNGALTFGLLTEQTELANAPAITAQNLFR